MNQLSLFKTESEKGKNYEPLKEIYGKNICIQPYRKTRENGLENILPLEHYDKIIVGLSGGKDSIASTLYLLELGVPKEKIILCHHLIDGKDTHTNQLLMDWPCTKDYCQQFADYLDLPLKYSWREGGFLGEILRLGASKPIAFEELESEEVKHTKTERWVKTETLQHELEKAEKENDIEKQEEIMLELKKLGYRFKFPAKSPSLTTRWCSSALKIEVFSRIIRYSDFTGEDCKILFVDGLRREESHSRSKYNEMEQHSCSAKTKNRIVHSWRNIIEWDEQMVWDIIKRHRINPHPCYKLGWNRCSCAMCIFSMPKHFKGIQEVMPERFQQLADFEREIGFTVDNKKDLYDYIKDANSCIVYKDPLLMDLVKRDTLPENYIYQEEWKMPAGAFQGCDGGPC